MFLLLSTGQCFNYLHPPGIYSVSALNRSVLEDYRPNASGSSDAVFSDKIVPEKLHSVK